MSTNKTPSGLRASGRRLWTSVLDLFELEEHESALLTEAARTVDVLDDLAAAVRRDGAMVQTTGGTKAHPAVVESRQQKIALARLLAALRLPAGDEGDHQKFARPQRRVGARGTYRIHGVS